MPVATNCGKEEEEKQKQKLQYSRDMVAGQSLLGIHKTGEEF